MFSSMAGENGALDASKLGKVLRCCGFALTQDELDALFQGRLAGKKTLSEKDYVEMLEQEQVFKVRFYDLVCFEYDELADVQSPVGFGGRSLARPKKRF